MTQNITPTDDFSELRSRAEQSLKKSQLKTISISSSPEEMLQLIHELAVHQIELEIHQQELIESKEELEKSLKRYTDLYDFAPLGYLTLEPDSRIIELNLTAATILDSTRSRLSGKRLNSFIVHEDRLTFAALLERVFSRKEPNYCEVILSVTDNGTLSQKTVRIEAVINDNEHTCRTILSDISKQKKIEQSLLVTNERQCLIIDATHSGSWEWDLQSNRAMWSNELWRLLGLEPFSCEATYEVWKQSIADEERERVEQIVLNAVEHGEEFTVEWRVKDMTGQKRWVMMKGTPFKEDDGEVNRYIGIFIEVTKLKMAQKIGQNEQAFSKTIIDSIPGSFYIVGTDGYYTGWNNYQRDKIVGKPENEMREVLAISTIHPEDRALVQEKIRNVLEYGLEENVEGRVLVHGGPEFRWYLMTGRRIIMEGNPFLIGIGIDISERKKIEDIQVFLSSSTYLAQKELDDITDMLYTIVNRMKVYKVAGSNKNLIEFSSVISESVRAVSRAVKGLRDPKRSKDVSEACVEVNRLENLGDTMRDDVLAELFETEKDPVAIIKLKEIYQDAETVLDICEDVAQVVQSILVKQA